MYSLPLKAITKVINEDAYLNIVISNLINQSELSDHERRLFTKIVYGTVENKIWIDYQLQPFIKGKRLKPYLKNTLRMGVYLLTKLDIANHHVVNELVRMVKKRDYKGSRLVNGVMRRFLESPRRPVDNLDFKDYLHYKYSMPYDLIEIFKSQYPESVEEICALNGQTSPNQFRINNLLTSPQEISEVLNREKIPFEIEGSLLTTPISLVNHPLLLEGKITPQDASSMRVAQIVAPISGDRVLDACSAPGGKAMHLADLMQNKGEIIACDIYQHKLNLIEEASNRLGVQIVKTKLIDIRDYPKSETFRHVLVDAPCSGLGVIKHKADLKYRMTFDKIKDLINLQKEILDSVTDLVSDDGYLTYSTCTINKQENEFQIDSFLRNHPEFKKIKEEAILPSQEKDGFYICKLQKIRK